jgi:hypothetical protein
MIRTSLARFADVSIFCSRHDGGARVLRCGAREHLHPTSSVALMTSLTNTGTLTDTLTMHSVIHLDDVTHKYRYLNGYQLKVLLDVIKGPAYMHGDRFLAITIW